MKIKLITFAPHPNFGTCLQSYALNHVLHQMGHDVEFIYNGREVPPTTLVGYIKKVLVKIAKLLLSESAVDFIKAKVQKGKANGNKSIKSDPIILRLPNHHILYVLSKMPGYDKFFKWLKCRNLQWKKVYKFTYEDGNFNMRRIFIHKQYNELAQDTDLFITGSDQIWNSYCGGFNPMMFVEFGGDTKRIAYSSSISQSNLPRLVEQRIKNDLIKFQHIGVREQRSVDLLNKLLGRTDVRLVVDPTYLLSDEEWTKFGEKATLEFSLPDKYLFCYFVGDKHREVYERMVQDVKAFTGIKDVITLECYNRDLSYGGGRLYKDAGPYEWVNLLKHSSYVCMDSFHATVFALKFRKEFVHAMKNEDSETGSQNMRMYDILERYGLQHKLYIDHTHTNWQKSINYGIVSSIMEKEIETSQNYLKNAIEN